jgi:hypothetical protein
MRRSRWYSANPNSTARDSRLTEVKARTSRPQAARCSRGSRGRPAPRRSRAGFEFGVGGADRAALTAREPLVAEAAAHGTGRERGVEPRERQQLQQERLGNGSGIGRTGIERAQARQQEHEQPNAALVLLCDLVDGLEHRPPAANRPRSRRSGMNGVTISA